MDKNEEVREEGPKSAKMDLDQPNDTDAQNIIKKDNCDKVEVQTIENVN